MGKAWMAEGALVCDIEIEYVTVNLGDKGYYGGAPYIICESIIRTAAMFFADCLKLEWDWDKQKELDAQHKINMDVLREELKRMDDIIIPEGHRSMEK